jgi:protocatechuate 3,4-dioxygenase beta subunit
MQIKNRFRWGQVSQQVFNVLMILMLTACGTQAPASPTPTAQEIIPVTGQDTPTALPDAKVGTLEPTQPGTQAETPACKAPATPTPALTEGPYFKGGSPERTSLLENGVTGTTLTLSGFVLTTDCKPVPHALLDFWQANAQGQYDNAGFTLRGHQFTDANGHYELVTVVPGEYPGRTEHIHVKVQAPNGPVLTSQLFFPGVPDNARDGIYDQSLLITIQSGTSTEMKATYNFIVSGSQ